MNKPSAKLTKSILGLVMSLGTQAFAKNQVVTTEFLLKNNMEKLTIQELIDEKILLATNFKNHFELNGQKISVILQSSNNAELKEFLMWIKSIVGDDTQVNLRNSGDMVISSQDGGNIL